MFSTFQETKEFVEGLFAMQLMTKKPYEVIACSNNDKSLEKNNDRFFLNDNIEGLYYYVEKQYRLNVGLVKNEDKVLVRLNHYEYMKNLLSDFDIEDIKDEFSLEGLSVNNMGSRIIYAVCNRETCKDFLIWLYKEIDEFKEIENIDSSLKTYYEVTNELRDVMLKYKQSSMLPILQK